MSARNRPEAKRQRRLLKSLRNTPPAYIDLREWIQMRVKCSKRTAEKVLLAGGLRVDSHPVGYKWANDPVTGNAVRVLDPYLPAHFRDRIQTHKVEVPK